MRLAGSEGRRPGFVSTARDAHSARTPHRRVTPETGAHPLPRTASAGATPAWRWTLPAQATTVRAGVLDPNGSRGSPRPGSQDAQRAEGRADAAPWHRG